MTCDHLELLIEPLADGSYEAGPGERAHLDTCPRCQARLANARDIERWLIMRETPAPPAAFTQGVMALVSHERWQAERVVDLGFNLAMAAGVLVILAGAAGLAWSLGFLTIAVDFDGLLAATQSELGGRVLSQIQTIGTAAIVLTIALVLWWWAEADSSF